MKRHCEEMREEMEADHEKSMMEVVEQIRAEILNNSSASGTNNAIPDPSMPSPTIKSFDEKKTGMTGIDCKDKYREEENTRRDMGEEMAKSVRDEFCATLQHSSEAMRKDHERLTREALESMRSRVRK